jgi:hypothetical protein
MLEAIDAERGTSIPRSIWREAVEQVRGELEEYVKNACSKPYPPSSKPGNYPNLRTGEFVDGLSVVYSEEAAAFRLYSKTHDNHGRFLAEGLRDGTTRPYGALAAQAKDWSARVTRVARKMNGER